MSYFKDASGNSAVVSPSMSIDRPREASSFVSEPLTGERIVEIWVTAYDVVDKVGDTGTYGMFAKTLRKYRDANRRIPVTENHEWASTGVLGYILPDEITEVRTGGPGGKGGLYARAHLFVAESKAAKFVCDTATRLQWQASYAYDTVAEQKETKGALKGANRLTEVNLLEVTICLFGAVEQTAVALKIAEANRVLADFDAVLRLDAKKTSETGAGPVQVAGDTSGEQNGGVVAPDYSGRVACPGCGRFGMSMVMSPYGETRVCVNKACREIFIQNEKSLEPWQVANAASFAAAALGGKAELVPTRTMTRRPLKTRKRRAIPVAEAAELALNDLAIAEETDRQRTKAREKSERAYAEHRRTTRQWLELETAIMLDEERDARAKARQRERDIADLADIEKFLKA